MSFTLMKDRDDAELKKNIEDAVRVCDAVAPGQNLFWKICTGIDAYFEKRKRKEAAEAKKLPAE